MSASMQIVTADTGVQIPSLTLSSLVDLGQFPSLMAVFIQIIRPHWWVVGQIIKRFRDLGTRMIFQMVEVLTKIGHPYIGLSASLKSHGQGIMEKGMGVPPGGSLC